LVSISPSKVVKFNFECSLLVQEINSVIHYCLLWRWLITVFVY
jgi:hypothetical protein